MDAGSRWENHSGRPPKLQCCTYLKIKHSCAVVCWIVPKGRCGGKDRAVGGTGIKKSENKGHIVCCNIGNNSVWLEMSDCLLGSSWQGCSACWENCPMGCLIAPNQHWIYNILYFAVGTRMLRTARIWRSHCLGYSTTVLYFVMIFCKNVSSSLCIRYFCSVEHVASKSLPAWEDEKYNY